MTRQAFEPLKFPWSLVEEGIFPMTTDGSGQRAYTYCSKGAADVGSAFIARCNGMVSPPRAVPVPTVGAC